MPPKKGKGKKKGGGKKKKKDDVELTIDDKYQQTLSKIESLKDHLAIRKELARRSQAASEEWKKNMKFAQEDLVKQRGDQKEVTSEITRQYKAMQEEMAKKIYHLEEDLKFVKLKLAKTETELKDTIEEKARIIKEKDETIQELQLKIDSMETSYENVLRGALDNLVEKLDDAKEKWEYQSTRLHEKNKRMLEEFGLHPLEI